MANGWRRLRLRRTKGEVASDLQPRTEIIETVQMQA